MLDDDKPATPTQQQQIAMGQYLALSAAVHALIASHRAPAVFSAMLDAYAAETEKILLLMPVLQHDDGGRQAYSEVLSGLYAAIPPH